MLFGVLIIIPGSHAGLFNGLPLNNYEILILFVALIFIWLFRWKEEGGLKNIFLLLLSFLIIVNVLGSLFLPYGWSVCLKRIALSGEVAKSCEPSAEFRSGKKSFIANKIDYSGKNFPLYFMNDLGLNYYSDGQPDREHLEYDFSAHSFFQTSGNGGNIKIFSKIPKAQIEIDGKKSYIETGEESTYSLPPNKLVSVSIQYRTERNDEHVLKVHANSAPLLRQTLLNNFYSSGVFLFRLTQFSLLAIIVLLLILPMIRGYFLLSTTLKYIVGLIPVWFIYCYLAPINPYVFFSLTLFGIIWVYLFQEKEENKKLFPYLVIIIFASTYLFVSFVSPYNRLILFSGGNDELGHEGFARQVLVSTNFHQFAEAGEISLFYYQPMHRYFLALLHLLFGEPMWGPYLIQTLLSALAVFLSIKYLKKISIVGALVASFIFCVSFSQPSWSLFGLSQSPYQQGIATPLFLVVIFWLLNLSKEQEVKKSVYFYVGLIMSAVVGMRLDLIPVFLPIFIYPFFVKSLRSNKGELIKTVMVLGLGMAIFPVLIIARNYYIAGEASLFATSTMVNVLPAFRDEVPYIAGPSKMTGGQVILMIIRNHQGRYGELVTALSGNIYDNFMGYSILRRLLWLTVIPSFLAMLFLHKKNVARFATIVSIFLLLLISSAFFLPHNGPAMMAHFDFLVIVIVGMGSGVLIELLIRHYGSLVDYLFRNSK